MDRRTRFRWGATALAVLALVVAGCSRPAQPPAVDVTRPAEVPANVTPPAPAPVPAPAQAPAGEASPAVAGTAASLFPSQDLTVSFQVWDEGSNPVEVTEQLVRAGNRVAAAYNGRVYLTWHLLESGVWRRDPKGGGALLRYLPPVLKDGLAWKQSSGDAEVWFKLSRTEAPCLKYAEKPPRTCWQLAVLNRGEWTGFRFSPEYPLGPNSAQGVAWKEGGDAYEKTFVPWGKPDGAAADRTDLLSKAEAPPAGSLPAVVGVSLAEFQAEVRRQLAAALPQQPVTPLDLDGDAEPDLIRGPVGEWTTAAVEFFRPDGQRLARFAPGENHQQRFTRRDLAGDKRPYFVYESGDPLGRRLISIVGYEEKFNQGGAVLMGWGFEPKLFYTYGTAWEWTDGRTFTVTWRMGDPARHVRVSRWTITGFAGEVRSFGPDVVHPQSQQMRPEGAELAYPGTPQGVLEAAFFAVWYELGDELGRYFANPGAKTALESLKETLPRPTYEPGTVAVGKLGPAPRTGAHQPPVPTITAAEPAADGSAEFMARWSGYEFVAAAWGQVTFVRSAENQWRIAALTLGGNQIVGP